MTVKSTVLHRPRKPWRLIFNWDGGRVFDMPSWVTDADEFREKAIQSFLAVGADVIPYSLNMDWMPYDSHFGQYAGQFDTDFYDVRKWAGTERGKYMIKEGRFPLTVLIEEGHKAGLDVLASFRMNDTHDLYYSPQTPLAGISPARFKLEHPELLIKDDQGWTKYCLDFAHQAVRDRRFNLIHETVERFDVDGVELDFMRNGFFFQKGSERKRSPLMTELVRRVRQMLNDYETRRNKRLHLAVHTPVTQEVSLNCGLDVVRWINEKLVDQVVADEGCTPFNIAPEDFILAAKKQSDCRIYSTCDVGLGNPERPEENKGCDSTGVPWTEEQLRGWAAFQLNAGVDGLNLFNGHFGNAGVLARVFGKNDVWEKLSASSTSDKTFVVHNRSFTANMPQKAIPQLDCLPKPLKVSSNGKAQCMDVFVTDDLVAAHDSLQSIILRMVFRQLTVEDELQIKVNNCIVAALGKRGSALTMLSELSGQPIGKEIAEYLIPVEPEALQQGRNTIKVLLRYRNPKILPPLVWKNAELRICYKGYDKG